MPSCTGGSFLYIVIRNCTGGQLFFTKFVIFCKKESNFNIFLFRGSNFGLVLYRGSNFGHFCRRWSKQKVGFCCTGGLKNAKLLYRGVSKMPFCCIGGLDKAIFV